MDATSTERTTKSKRQEDFTRLNTNQRKKVELEINMERMGRLLIHTNKI
jgi:hypothetical protein